MLRSQGVLATWVCAIAGFAAHAQTWSLTDLGSIPDASFVFPVAISADGSAVAGGFRTVTQGQRYLPFRWTRDEGFQLLGALGDRRHAIVSAISADGAVMVGYSSYAFGVGPRDGSNRAFRWTESSGMQDIGSLSSSGWSVALGVNGDGSVIVGESGSTYLPFRWSAGAGMQQLAIPPLSNAFAWADAISDDGAVIAGLSSSGMFRVDSDGVARVVGWPPGLGNNNVVSLAMSRDGAAIVGTIETHPTAWTTRRVAFRWTAESGAHEIGSLAPDQDSGANSASNLGAVVVGSSGGRAYIWSGPDGTLDLRAFLIGNGAAIQGWTLTSAAAISADGKTIAGSGTNPAGQMRVWLAHLDLERCSLADVAGVGGGIGPDGHVTVDDLVVFLNAYFGGNTSIADVAAVGGGAWQDLQLTPDDVIVFLSAFMAGCP